MECRICRAATDKDKPFCAEHIDKLPYIQLLRQYDRSRSREAKISGRSINLNGLLATEILESINLHERINLNYMAQLLDVKAETLKNYIDAMVSANYVQIVDAERVVIKLTDEGHSHYQALKHLV